MSNNRTISQTSRLTEAPARRAMQGAGVSTSGVEQFLKAHIVGDAVDRGKLAGLALSFLTAEAEAMGNTKVHLLRLGVSPPGIDQFLQGRIVVNPADRARLAQVVVLGFTPPIGSNKGSIVQGIIAVLIGL